jgi:type I restriction enzyme, S subunit
MNLVMIDNFPKEWQLRSASEIFEFINGKAFYSDGYADDGYVVVDLLNINLNGKFQLTKKDKYISSDIYQKFPRSHLYINDLIIIMTDITPTLGLIGKTAIIDQNNIYVLNQRVGCLRMLDKNNISINFYNYMFNSEFVRRQVIRNTLGTAQFYINTPQIKNLIIPSPPLLEQNKIASILTSVDEVIEKTQSKINKLQGLKKTTMNELLTKGIGHTEFKDGPLGKIPKSWLVTKLKKVAKVNDGTHKTPKYITQGIPFLRVTDLKNKYPMKGNNKYISISEHQELIRRCKPEKGDILYSKNGTIGIPRIIDWEGDFSIFVSLALIKINRDSNILSEYLEIYLSCEIISQEIKNRAKQGAVTNLHLEEIREFLTIIPNIEEQKQIIKICRSLNQNIGLQKDKVLKLTQLKKSLTQDLLTGKVRVSVN